MSERDMNKELEKLTKEDMDGIWGGSTVPDANEVPSERNINVKEKQTDLFDAYCAVCNSVMRSTPDGMYKCFNSECKEFNHSKTAKDVAWRAR